MTIQEVEKLAGMTRANIRFYEKEGLITPERNEANNYRAYSDRDVEALRKIKHLRILGISVKDIKRIIENELELPEAAEYRLEELKEEKKNLEEIEWMCRYIRQHNVQYETMDSEVFEEKMGRLTEVFKDVLSMDTEKEYITVRQLNRTIGLILIYGFVLSAVLSFFFGNIFRNGHFTWLFAAWCIISIATELVFQCTSKLGIQFVLFQILALLLAPAVHAFIGMGVMGLQVITKEQVALEFLLIAIFLLLILLISMKKREFLRNYRNTAVAAVIYSGLAAVGLYFSIGDRKAFLILTVILILVNVFTGFGWVSANLNKENYTRFYAVTSAASMFNIVSLLLSQQGRNMQGGRWKDANAVAGRKDSFFPPACMIEYKK